MDDTRNVARICLNGHVISAHVRMLHPSDRLEKEAYAGSESREFCQTCGLETTTCCSECKAPIPGSEYPNYSVNAPSYILPKFCRGCGEPFPWTRSSLDAAKQLAYTLGLDDGDADALASSIDDLVAEGPRTEVGISQFKRLTSKVGPTAKDLFGKVLSTIVTEAVKQQVFS